MIAYGSKTSSNLVVEDPKVLVNLSLKGLEQVDKFILPSFLKKLNKSRPVKALSETSVVEKQH